MSEPRLSILLLCDDRPMHANTIRDHINALGTASRQRVQVFNPIGLRRSPFLNFDQFDAVVIHFTLLCSSDYYLHPTFREQLSRYRGLKVQFIQDEYRSIDEITAAMRDMGVGLIFTCLPEAEAERIYGTRVPGAAHITTLTGYVPDNLVGVNVPRLSQRPIDIGYRAREIPYWLGRFGQEKQLIARGILEHADRYHLRCDISSKEEERIYGSRWVEFLMSCRATLGTGSGASIADFDGSLQRQTNEYLEKHPGASFEEVDREVLKPYEGTLQLDVISPRIFEAIALRTALILFPSSYSGVIRAWDHYLPLAKDFSNLDEIVRNLRDDDVVEQMTDRAYRAVVETGAYSYREFANQFDQALAGKVVRARGGLPSYQVARLHASVTRLRLPARFHAMVFLPIADVASATLRSGLRRTELPTLVRLADDPDENARKASLALRAAFHTHEMRSLLFRWSMSRSRRRTTSLDAVLDDMLKIDILREAREGRLTAGEEFRAWPHLTNGVLELRSAPLGKVDRKAVDGAVALRALEEGDVKTVVWNHSPVATHVFHALPLRRRRCVRLTLGKDGRHDFTWIRELLVRDRAAAVRLLRPALADPVKTALDQGLPPAG